VAILATATMPSTEVSVSPASERSVFVFINCDMFKKKIVSCLREQRTYSIQRRIGQETAHH
jgi:hypothetical protein